MGIDTAPGDDERGDRRAQPAAHVLLVVGPGRARPDRHRPRRGRLPLHARRQADPRLQQPADVGEHRPRRPTRHRRDHRAGDEAAVRAAGLRHGDPRPARRRSWPRSCRATSTRCSSRSAAPRRSRTRSSSPATTRAATRSWPATAPTTARPSGAMTLTGDPRRWANEPGLVGVVRYPDTHRWGEAEPRPVEESLQGLEDVIRYEGAAHDRGGLPRDDRRHQRHPHPARRLPPGRPRDLRPPRHPDGRRRGDGRLRADRALVRGRPLGRRPGPDDDGQGPDELVPAARRGRDAPRRSPRRSRPKMFYGGLTYSSHPVWLRGGAGDDRRLRGGRPASATPPRMGAVMRAPPRAARGEAPVRRARIATSACSGSSTSSGRATRGRR